MLNRTIERSGDRVTLLHPPLKERCRASGRWRMTAIVAGVSVDAFCVAHHLYVNLLHHCAEITGYIGIPETDPGILLLSQA
jgi:hypothetical protein